MTVSGRLLPLGVCSSSIRVVACVRMPLVFTAKEYPAVWLHLVLLIVYQFLSDILIPL